MTQKKGSITMKNMNETKLTPAAKIEAEAIEAAAHFQTLISNYEAALASGADITEALYELAKAAAASVVKKCIDPQRKSATLREEVSNNGHNPALSAVRRGIMADMELLKNTAEAHAAATNWKYNDNGDIVTEVVDQAAEKAAAALQGETLTDGIDLIHAAALAILEMSEAHAAATGWMEAPYTARRISRRVYVKMEDSAKWEEEETTPIREVYRSIRREVQNSRAMQTDPRNGYTYIEDVAADPDSNAIETIYRRLGKYADLGGYTCDMNGKPKFDGTYTADMQTVMDYNDIMERLNLTERQATIIGLRMRGYGVKAIATYIGVKVQTVQCALKRLQERCENIGFTPEMWKEMNETN